MPRCSSDAGEREFIARRIAAGGAGLQRHDAAGAHRRQQLRLALDPAQPGVAAFRDHAEALLADGDGDLGAVLEIIAGLQARFGRLRRLGLFDEEIDLAMAQAGGLGAGGRGEDVAAARLALAEGGGGPAAELAERGGGGGGGNECGNDEGGGDLWRQR